MNLAQILVVAANEHGLRPALQLADGHVSFRELERRAGVAAARLGDLGVEPGDRVGLRLPNGPDFAAAWFGALRLGAIVVPLNILLAPREIEERMRVSGARLLVDDPGLLHCGPAPEAGVKGVEGAQA